MPRERGLYRIYWQSPELQASVTERVIPEDYEPITNPQLALARFHQVLNSAHLTPTKKKIFTEMWENVINKMSPSGLIVVRLADLEHSAQKSNFNKFCTNNKIWVHVRGKLWPPYINSDDDIRHRSYVVIKPVSRPKTKLQNMENNMGSREVGNQIYEVFLQNANIEITLQDLVNHFEKKLSRTQILNAIAGLTKQENIDLQKVLPGYSWRLKTVTGLKNANSDGKLAKAAESPAKVVAAEISAAPRKLAVVETPVLTAPAKEARYYEWVSDLGSGDSLIKDESGVLYKATKLNI